MGCQNAVEADAASAVVCSVRAASSEGVNGPAAGCYFVPQLLVLSPPKFIFGTGLCGCSKGAGARISHSVVSL